MPATDRVEPSASRLQILVAEDSPVIKTVLKSMLGRWGYDPILVADGVEAWRILQSDHAPRLAIVDWMMPGIDGVELCRHVRCAGKEVYTYILLLTSRDASSDVVEALDAGADDYLTKPFNAHELRARLRAGRRIIDMQEQLLVTREALRKQATLDALTELLNRGAILQVLERDLARADKQGQPFTVLLADVDRFRQINESFGHLAGDAVLRECGRRIQASAPPSASVGRFGGEEFLVVLPGLGADAAAEHADRIRLAIGDDPFNAGAASFPITCTLGTAGRETPYTSDSATLLREADEALQNSRRECRERVAQASRAANLVRMAPETGHLFRPSS